MCLCHPSLIQLLCLCRSKHEEIELVSLEEFYSEAPTEISRPDITLTEPHQQTLARLDWELEQRKRWVHSASPSLSCRTVLPTASPGCTAP